MRVRSVLDRLLSNTWVTLVTCVLLAILLKRARGILFGLPSMIQRPLVTMVIRVKRAMITIRRAVVRLVSMFVSVCVAELLILVLILLNISALILLVPLRIIPSVSTM